ncbi:TonB-dependent receptor [Hymenobacter koreensis]|uniref:TonB-dependent receptor n=1 Tax=Hymenobacter koreensis TaxID=1084523 RepID=A0ABP8IXZ4_9BACT
MQKTVTLLLLPAALLTGLTAQAQTRQVSGVVVNGADKTPLPGVSVVVKGTTTGVATDPNGQFSLTLPAEGRPVLVFSFVGFASQEVTVGSGGTVGPVTLQEATTALNDVVVVGYGTQRKRDLTGSVGSVSAEQVAEVPIARADQILQGRVSGVQVTQTNSEPGGNVSVRIRGTNSINSGNEPLFVVDGFPGAGDLNSINPADIESIEVLKDASSTAIYGSRGANGVVLITTKKGKAGKNSVNAEVYSGVQIIRKQYELMNAQEYATYLNEVRAQTNATTPPLYTQDQINQMGEGTDWQDAILRRARISNYQVGFNGGTEETRYNLSFNYFDQEGIILNSGFQRGTVRLNLNKKISRKLSLDFSSQVAGTFEKRAFVNSQGGSFGGVLLDALRFSPINPVYDANGIYTFSNTPVTDVDDVGNPVAYAEKVKDRRSTARGLLNVAGNYELVKGLTLRVTGGLDYNNQQQELYRPSDIFLGRNTGGSAFRGSVSRYSWVNENTLTYDRQLSPNHALNVVGGFSAQRFYGVDFNARTNNFFTNDLGTDNLALGASPLPPTSGRYFNSLASYFGRVNYRLFEKYLFTVTMRADGSSRFGPNNKWGYFPSAAVAYRLIDEKFMQRFTALSDLKLRLSYGVTGNQEIANYQSLARYDVAAYASGSGRLVGLASQNIENPDLRWESTASGNVGLDLALFQNRIVFTADYYQKQTNDLLLFVNTPPTTGYPNVLVNVGKVGNKGLELALSTTNVELDKFSWTSNLNFSLNRNKVLSLGEGETERLVGSSSTSLFPGGTGFTSILRVGQPIGSFYGYVFDGIYQTQEEINASGIRTPVVRPGDPRYLDLNGDGSITGADRTIIGQAQPDYIFGATNNFKYGGLTLSVFVQGVQGSDVLNLNRYELESGITSTNKLKSVVNRWNGPGTSNTIPRANSVLRRSTGIVSDVVEDGSFVRLKTVTLSYALPKLGIVKSSSVYVTALNLVTWTKYSGYDPEVNSFGNENLSLNTDYNAFPTTRSFTAGVRVGF